MLNADPFFNNSTPREFTNLNPNQPKDQEAPQTNKTTNESNPTNTNNTNQSPGNYFQSEIPVRRTDSPQRFISQTTIQPNQFQQQQQQQQQQPPNTNNSPGIPIKIQHISTLPHKSDFTSRKHEKKKILALFLMQVY